MNDIRQIVKFYAMKFVPSTIHSIFFLRLKETSYIYGIKDICKFACFMKEIEAETPTSDEAQ